MYQPECQIWLIIPIQKVLSEGFQLLTFLFLLVDEGREDPNITQIGPSLAHQRSLADRWWPNIVCWLDIFVIFHEIWTSIDKEPCSFVIFQWGGRGLDPCSFPLDLCMRVRGSGYPNVLLTFNLLKHLATSLLRDSA